MVALTWLESLRGPNGKGRAQQDLEDMIKPYREAILYTSTPPPPSHRVLVLAWEDLVRASDTLGKPILQYRPVSDPVGHVLYVLDGTVGYVYDHGGPTARSGALSADAAGTVRVVNQSPPARSPASTPPSPGTPTFRWNAPQISSAMDPASPSFSEEDLRARARALLIQLRQGPAFNGVAQYPPAELRQAIEAMREGRLDEADRKLAAVERRIGG